MADEQSTEIFDDLYLGLRAGGALRKQRRGEPLTDRGAGGARPLAAAVAVAQGDRDRRLRRRHVRPRLHPRRPDLRPLAQSLIEVVRGDITQQALDAIVNAANSSAARRRRRRRRDPPRGRARRSCARVPAARRLRDRRARRRPDAGRLPARWVIHTVGPVWRGGDARRAGAARVVPPPLARRWPREARRPTDGRRSRRISLRHLRATRCCRTPRRSPSTPCAATRRPRTRDARGRARSARRARSSAVFNDERRYESASLPVTSSRRVRPPAARPPRPVVLPCGEKITAGTSSSAGSTSRRTTSKSVDHDGRDRDGEEHRPAAEEDRRPT